MSEKPTIIDRGVDEILVIGERTINIEKMSGRQLIELLNRYQLTNVEVVSFDQYELSNKYPKAIL